MCQQQLLITMPRVAYSKWLAWNSNCKGTRSNRAELLHRNKCYKYICIMISSDIRYTRHFFFEKHINPNASVQSFAKVGMKVDYTGY